MISLLWDGAGGVSEAWTGQWFGIWSQRRRRQLAEANLRGFQGQHAR
jgi:hypothetical protein